MENNNWYYLNTNGSMKTGWLQIGKDWFYLNTNGAMATDTYINLIVHLTLSKNISKTT